MTTQTPLTGGFSGGRDMLGYPPGATPSADVWLATFTSDFIAHADGTHGAHALMSGLRFYTAAFVAEIAAFTEAMPTLLAEYNSSTGTSHGIGY